MRLFHFSDDPDIAVFEPRPVLIPSVRPIGREWLNGPLVWAIDGDHDFMYLFPRDCPRILIWATAETTEAERRHWLGDWRAAAFNVCAGLGVGCSNATHLVQCANVSMQFRAWSLA